MDRSRLKRILFGELSWRRFAKSLMFIYTTFFIIAVFFADFFIFPAPEPSYRDDGSIGTFKLKTRSGLSFSVVHLREERKGPTILFSHGNGEDLGDIHPFLEDLRGMGFNVAAYDYPGYGTSEGRPTEKGAYETIEAVYDYLTQAEGVEPEKIVIYGRSVGSGPSVDLASRKPVGGLILESPFLSAFRVVTRVSILPFDRFKNFEKVSRVECPVLIIHGRLDRVIPFSHGESLFNQFKVPKSHLWVDEAGHNDLHILASSEIQRAILEFKSKFLAGPKSENLSLASPP
jgi:abhydrolase domain-containing protein 17